MKTKLVVTLCVLVVSWAGATPASATDQGAAMVADVAVVRPVCFVATIVGSAFFVISLPLAATSRSVHRAAQTLVVAPAKATFTRPLGDLDSLKDY